MRRSIHSARLYGQAEEELRTIRDLIRFGATRFSEAGLAFGHGTDNAFDEAAWLVSHSLRVPIDRLEDYLAARIPRAERGITLGLIRRRIDERVPVAYLIGEAWLGEHRFLIDSRVIVPRSFIAEMLTTRLVPWLPENSEPAEILDLCTGSGCLAICAAHAFPNAIIHALDLSPEALEVAKINVNLHCLEPRVQLYRGDLFTPLGKRRYDVILANPPYVASAAMAALPAEYRHEPRIALSGGSDGLDIVRRLLANAGRHLNPHGLLVVETGHARERVEAAFPGVAFMWPEVGGGDCVFVLGQRELAASPPQSPPRKRGRASQPAH